MTGRTLLLGGRGADGARLDIAVDAVTGTVTGSGPSLLAEPGDHVEDCAGLVLLVAPAEPHAHLDKALSADRAPNPAGDLAGAITAWRAQWPALTHGDLVERATAAVGAMVANGTTAIRSHVDIGEPLGLAALDALVEVRDATVAAGLADVQLVALVSSPLTGSDGAANRRLLDAALAAGADVAGGCPYRDPDPVAATALVLAVAAAHGVPVDLHTDETLDPTVLTLADLADQVGRRGPRAGVTASHCVSLGMQPAERQAAVARAVAAAGIGVVTLPQTNLYLQARAWTTAAPRGLTALDALRTAGVTVAGGADNVRDPFCAVGRMDATETAALLVMAGHLTPGEAWAVCSAGGRAVMGLAPAGLHVGAAADVLAIEGASLADAVAGGGARRLTIHRGHVVARTDVRRTLRPIPQPLEA